MENDVRANSKPTDRAVDFVIPGDPVAWMRPRADSRGKFVRIFNTKKHDAYLITVGQWARKAMLGFPPFDDPCSVTVIAYLGIPKSWPKWKQRDAAKGTLPCMAPKDADNILKIVTDGMNKIVFLDDRQVTETHGYKRWSHEPRVLVRVVPHGEAG
jgi:Holliday junction resolvase RusA-like endonuclease